MNSIVIGSGFGGIAAALRLKAKGHEVTLIEKHPDLGGRARVFKKNGFTYDGGPTVITAPYLINELFELFKKDPKDYIKLSPLKVWYQFVFEDNSKFNYSGTPNQYYQLQGPNAFALRGKALAINVSPSCYSFIRNNVIMFKYVYLFSGIWKNGRNGTYRVDLGSGRVGMG